MATLLEQWRNDAYYTKKTKVEDDKFWDKYFEIEKRIYEILLAAPSNKVSGTLQELATRYDTTVYYMTGFVDGINDSLNTPVNIEKMTEDTEIVFDINYEKLYYNMVEAKADWLYELKEWDSILSEEDRKRLYKEQKASGTVVKKDKIGRNDPCTCGSGKKYKKCCGK